MNSETTQADEKDALFFRWLGVGGIQLRWRERVLLIDPFLTRPSLKEVLWQPLRPNTELLQRELPQAEAILITHAHYDHLMDTPEIMRQSGACAFGSENAVRLLRATGVSKEKCISIQNGEILEISPFQIHVIEGKHIFVPFFTPTQLPQEFAPPQRPWDYKMDRCFSFLIANTDPSILVWHSVRVDGAIPAQVLVFDAELSFATLEQLLRLVKPRLLIPIHWDDFFLPLSAPLKPFFRPLERGYFRLGRLNVIDYVQRLQYLLPTGKVYLPERLKEVTLSLIDAAAG